MDVRREQARVAIRYPSDILSAGTYSGRFCPIEEHSLLVLTKVYTFEQLLNQNDLGTATGSLQTRANNTQSIHPLGIDISRMSTARSG